MFEFRQTVQLLIYFNGNFFFITSFNSTYKITVVIHYAELYNVNTQHTMKHRKNTH